MARKYQCDYQIQLVVVQSQKFEAPGCVYVVKDFLFISLEIWNYLLWTISSLRVEIFNNNQKSLCISGLEKNKNNFSKAY